MTEDRNEWLVFGLIASDFHVRTPFAKTMDLICCKTSAAIAKLYIFHSSLVSFKNNLRTYQISDPKVI